LNAWAEIGGAAVRASTTTLSTALEIYSRR
jgi:hypothetical protein